MKNFLSLLLLFTPQIMTHSVYLQHVYHFESCASGDGTSIMEVERWKKRDRRKRMVNETAMTGNEACQIRNWPRFLPRNIQWMSFVLWIPSDAKNLNSH